MHFFLGTLRVKTTCHLNLKLLIFNGYTASFKIFSIHLVQEFGNFERSPMLRALGTDEGEYNR